MSFKVGDKVMVITKPYRGPSSHGYEQYSITVLMEVDRLLKKKGAILDLLGSGIHNGYLMPSDVVPASTAMKLLYGCGEAKP